jgi:hypothetical protein
MNGSPLKYLLATVLSVVSLLGGFSSCNKGDTAIASNPTTFNESTVNTQRAQGNKMKITIGSKRFNATLSDNDTAVAFKAMLPLTLKMDELNGNEKKYDFPKALPIEPSNPGKIKSGDLMIWQGKTLVLFYKSFESQYSYTRLGRLDDPLGLEKALARDSVSVTFELE